MGKVNSLILTLVLMVPLAYFYLISGAGYWEDQKGEVHGEELPVQQEVLCELEEKMKKAGFVDIQSLDPSIKVALKYSSEDNFLKEDVYGCLEKGYLHKEAAIKLVQAQRYLKELHPDYSLLVCDATRPLSVQYKMWEIVENTGRQPYVANPERGSMHNYGAGVDLTIVDSQGRELDMGTPVDYFGNLAQPFLEKQYLSQGKLTKEQVVNRRLLRTVMEKAGYRGITNEWWHFDAFDQNWTRKNLHLLP